MVVIQVDRRTGMTNRAQLYPMEESAISPPGEEEAKPSPRPLSIVELFESHESALIRFAYGIVKRREIAEEMVQEGMMKLHSHWSEVENPVAWVYRAIRNLCLNHLRKYQREEVDDKVVEIFEAAPENKLERMEAIGNMRLLVEELKPQDKQLIMLKYVEGKSYAEIAEIVGIGVGNVGYRLHHLLADLAVNLKKLGVESSKG